MEKASLLDKKYAIGVFYLHILICMFANSDKNGRADARKILQQAIDLMKKSASNTERLVQE